MLQIQNALGILSSQVPTGNLLWVDQVNGVDALATRGRMTIPFKTLSAAKNAAQSGDTIMVLPGTYDEDDLLKDDVNWFFFPGAIIDSTSGSPVFDTDASSITSIIGGHGEFYADGIVVNFAGSDAEITLEALRMESRNEQCIRCTSASGRIHVKVFDSIKAPSGVAIECNGSATEQIFEADSIDAGGYSIYGLAGGAYVKARTILCDSVPIKIEGGSAFVVEAFEIIPASDNSGVYHNTTAALLTVRGARIVSTGSASAVYIADAASNKVRLSECLLIADSGIPAIDAANAATQVHVLGGTAGNRDKGSNITVVPGSWVFNGALT